MENDNTNVSRQDEKLLLEKIANFQREVPVILKDTEGYGYNYADLPTIFEVINPLLKKHNLGFYQKVDSIVQTNCMFDVLVTTVFDTLTGYSISTTTRIPNNVELKGMNAFQVMGSGITYLRRYALSSLLGLVTDKDTDGNIPLTKKAKENSNKSIIDRNDDPLA